ncbi:MAG: imelysin family protein [Flavobacteriales bacterium]|nr:imelysin family protein [Flavobacteriales bacterium]
MRQGLFIVGLVVWGYSLQSCKGDDPKPQEEDFDRSAMFQNLASNVILPAYNSFAEKLTSFQLAFDAYKGEASASNLEVLRSAFDQAYLSWQQCAPYEFGPAANVGLRLTINTFPADTDRVHTLVGMEDYDLALSTNSAAKGLPALDFVLYQLNPDRLGDALVQEFIQRNLTLMSLALTSVEADWKDAYQDEFQTNLGSDVGSSLGSFVNAINQDFEVLKNANVGIPLGKKTLGVIQPEKVEALFSAQSIPLLIQHLESLKAAFNGNTGLGLDDHLDALDATYGTQSLSDAIQMGFDVAIASAEAIDGKLFDAIEQTPSQVEDLHTKLQSLVVLLKTDMPSQLGVQITYQDNDGD